MAEINQQWPNFYPDIIVYMDTDEQGKTEVITDLKIELPSSFQSDAMPAKVNGNTEMYHTSLCISPHVPRKHIQWWPPIGKCITICQQLHAEVIYRWYSTQMWNIVNYKANKLMPINVFVVDTENEILSFLHS